MSERLVILGGCGGIGWRLRDDALAAGYQPVVLDLPAAIDAHPAEEAEMIEVDATSPDSLAKAAASIGSGIAGLVNLCGFVTEAADTAKHDPNTWVSVIDGNLNSAFYAAKAFAPLVRNGGAIVNTGSGLGHFARPGYGPYAVSKAGIAALTRQLALELAPRVRVNCVAPSAVDTAFLRGGTGRSDEAGPPRLDVDAYGAAVPMQRIAKPADITGPILFFLSPAAGYVTGQVLHVNGGSYMP